MQIIAKDDEITTVALGELHAGDCFSTTNSMLSPWVVIDKAGDKVMAFNLKTVVTNVFSDRILVEALDAQLIVRRKN